MVIDHFNTTLVGGAAIAARRLHAALLKMRARSRFWHLRRSAEVADDNSYLVMPWTDAPGRRMQRAGSELLAAAQKPWQKRQLRRALAGRPASADLFTAPNRTRETPCHPATIGSDLFHLHWIANFIDYRSFFSSIPDQFPIVWTVHDMNPFTGGCHYSHGCEAFMASCHDCPQLGARGARDLSYWFFTAKRRALRGKNLHVVAASPWMEQQARRSRLLREARSFRTIRYGLDVEQFRPQDKTHAKQSLGLPVDRPIIAFGAESLGSYRKGFRELLQALPWIKSSTPFTAVAFGDLRGVTLDRSLPEVKMLGFLDDELTLAQIYSAADVFVLPSLEEACGQTGLEAMACGTPVIGYDTGGIPDFVRPMETGLLAKVGDSMDLAFQLEWLLDRPAEVRRMGNNARRLIMREFHATKQAQTYLAFYRSLLDEETIRKPPLHKPLETFAV